MKADFQQMPTEHRPVPLWFWNNTEVMPMEIKKQMAQLQQAGYGGVSILPFGKDFKPKYLSEAYFEAYRVCLEEAKKLGMRVHIYDEYGFPSGTAGDINGDGVGRFKQRYPHLTNKRLDKTEIMVEKPGRFTATISRANLIGVVALDTLDHRRIDLSKLLKGEKIQWNAPQGAWKVMAFYCNDAGNSIVDYLDPEAASLYIEMTHEAYQKRFSDYFGNVVEGTFFDEPTMYYAEGRTWTPAFNEKFQKKYGFNPLLLYPALWYDIGPETVEARNYLFGFRAELFAEGYIRQVDEWSRKHGVYATGHLDNEEILNAVGTSGDFMKAFKYLEAPGIDKIGGQRPAERFYKLISSAAYNWDKYLVMSETFGDMGNISWDELFRISIDQYSKGINTLIPHAAWYNDQKVTFLPELSLRNPLYADSLRTFTDYLTRLNVLLKNDARWLGDIAVLYPIASMQGDHYFDGPLDYYKGGVELPYLDYTDLSVHLFDSLGFDHMYLHPEVLDAQCKVKDGQLSLHNKRQHNNFKVIVVPASRSLSLRNIEKIDAFAAAGGTVLFTTQLPAQATRREDDEKLRNILKGMLKRNNVHFLEKPTVRNLQAALQQVKTPFLLQFKQHPIPIIQKELAGKRILFFGNSSSDEKRSSFVLDGHFDLACWDPHTGEMESERAIIKREGSGTAVTVRLAPFKSLFLIER
ncbi:glycosyl hydrolase [Sphingobacterium bambusae]|nr:glycosyl hydrolase [Sphingobacterium bambusae]WPL49559.1 glycosyl hydrolase [Sphingobacterium bambusae]